MPFGVEYPRVLAVRIGVITLEDRDAFGLQAS